MKNIYLLTELDDFNSMNKQGFTLVLEDNEALSERIEVMIKAQGGEVMYNKTYNNFIANPFLLSMSNYLKNSQ